MKTTTLLGLVCATMFLEACLQNHGSLRVHGHTELHEAACLANRPEVEKLIKRGFNPNDQFWYFRKFDGGNALNSYFDCLDGREVGSIDIDFVKMLLDSGANPNVAVGQNRGYTPLMVMVAASPKRISNRIQTMDFLLARGASLEPKGQADGVWGDNPLVLAATLYDTNTLRYLFDKGAPLRQEEIGARLTSRFSVCDAPTQDNGKASRYEEHNRWKMEPIKRTLDLLFEHGLLIDKKLATQFRNACLPQMDRGPKDANKNLIADYVDSKYSHRITE